MNFYESARFQYAAARLMVKLAQFRQAGRFSQKISAKSNVDIQLARQSDGSFNINVEDPGQSSSDDQFIKISLADLIAYVSERIIEKIDETTLNGAATPNGDDGIATAALGSVPSAAIEQLADELLAGRTLTSDLPPAVQDVIKRRVAETHREQRLTENQSAISRIDFARSQKLIAMSAPLISEMATALRQSADTLEVRSSSHGVTRPVLFLDRKMAADIETAIVDEAITPILGDITQFNKDNGWGKLKIENGSKTVSFSIPYDILPTMRQKLIDNMKKDLVYLQTYFVRDRTGDVVRLIAVGILPTPI
ncbi:MULTISPECIES: hypothetical protein [unclassified Rhizobium]|jgi:hypothetical protein|uniref:hypothetical protein n=1 Tax=unclassified Rhizobium TaxID=2613769 RepID=UPI0017ECC66E|nr:hypothetical protein [Rhizobium sp. UBA1881]